jgi:hypothetical protein
MGQVDACIDGLPQYSPAALSICSEGTIPLPILPPDGTPLEGGERIVPRLGRLDFDGAEVPSHGGEQIDFEALPRPQECEAGDLFGMEAPLPGIGHDEIFEKLSPQGAHASFDAKPGAKRKCNSRFAPGFVLRGKQRVRRKLLVGGERFAGGTRVSR